jgi:hypothetical protein
MKISTGQVMKLSIDLYLKKERKKERKEKAFS